MTFAELRRTVLQNCTLSTSYFGESVTYRTRNGASSTVRAKIERDKPREPSRERLMARQQVAETERIRVMVSRETNWAGSGIADTPLIGDTIERAASVDDVRPYTYAGEIVAQTDQFGTYIFERARRDYEARRHAQA